MNYPNYKLLNEEFDNLKNDLELELDLARSLENMSERLSVSLNAIDKAIIFLKNYLQSHPFESDAQEIDFFKKVKPAFSALRIEQILQHNLVLNKPIATNDIQLKYFTDEIKSLERFFQSNAFHYQYYKNGISELDTLYFLRNAEIPLLAAEALDIDLDFSTPMSYLFTKFIAYERLQHFILDQVAALNYPEVEKLQKAVQGKESMQWTGDTINIVELAYGLWLTGQINHGNVSLNQIVKWLEQNFGVTIGIAQRKFAEISRRKRISVTKFIDLMRGAIIRKIDSDYE